MKSKRRLLPVLGANEVRAIKMAKKFGHLHLSQVTTSSDSDHAVDATNVNRVNTSGTTQPSGPQTTCLNEIAPTPNLDWAVADDVDTEI
jgi:hypothetical protein